MSCTALATTHARGQVVRAAVVFTDSGGDEVDPTGVTARIKPPSGSTLVYVHGTDAELVKDEVGEYHVDVDANLAGTWYVRFEGTGTYQAAAEHSFKVAVGAF